MAEIKERYNFKYGGRKFTIVYNPTAASVSGVRCDIQDITSIVINNNLSIRKKQLLLHKLITGRRIKDFNNRGRVRMFAV